MDKSATGRPKEPLPLARRLALMALLLVALFESIHQFFAHGGLARSPWLRPVLAFLWPVISAYETARAWLLEHPFLALGFAAGALGVGALGMRYWLLFWHNQVIARLSGTYFEPEAQGFPSKGFDLLAEISRRPASTLFVGLEPSRGMFGYRWRPVYITQRQKTMHRHVIGKTGSGKTQSILWPAVLQDVLDGKGTLVMDAKGSDENVRAMKAIAGLGRREAQLRVFSLPAWNQPQIFSHNYNMLYVRPRSPGDPGGDPVPTAERVFSVLPLGDNEYYNVQAQIAFVNVCKLLHGMVDEGGFGLPFVMRDVGVLFKGFGNTGSWADAVSYCLENSQDREAAGEIQSQLGRLGRDVPKAFSGVVGAIDKFLSPLVNAYDPDIVFEELLEKNGLIYVQLPANLFKIQAPAIGRVLLMDVQQEGSLRQVFRTTKNQTPFSVNIDEFYNFADLSVIDSLNKLRDANLEFTLAHQSIADLEIVSKEFATAVWDNTRTKDILNQDNPELCEKVSRSLGTHQVVERTVRRQQGALFTSLTTGDASTKLVEAYKLHPNAIKNLARCGQGYLYNDEGLKPVAYSMLPPLTADYELTRKDQSKARGLRLYEKFIAASAHTGVEVVAAEG